MQHIFDVAGEAALTREVVFGDGVHRRRLLHHGVNGFAQRDGVDEAVEEGAVAADDVDFGIFEGLAQDARLLGCDLGLNLEALHLDESTVFELEAELLVFACGALHGLHRDHFFRDALGFGRHLVV